MANGNFNRDLTLTLPEFWEIATSKGLGYSRITEITCIDWDNFYRKAKKPLGKKPTRHWLGAIAQLEGWMDAEGNIV